MTSDYSILPRVALMGHKTRFTITPGKDFRGRGFESNGKYIISLMPVERYHSPDGKECQETQAEGSRLSFEAVLQGEQEYIVEVRTADSSGDSPPLRFNVYSLKADLYSRNPYKGDLHLHTDRSDGQEPPDFVAACCRTIGLDFMAITDHGQYGPSLEAREAFTGLQPDMLICPGEEVHPPNNPVHLINFGGSASINGMFASPHYMPQVQAIMDGLGHLPHGVDPYQFASTLWCFDRIREMDGLGIYCHPFWRVSDGYTPSMALTNHIFDEQPFDAFELIGGYHKFELDSNTLQVAYYNEGRLKGKHIAIVGSSDSHGCRNGTLFGWYYTICFAPTLTQADIIAGIKGHSSVAVEAVEGEHARIFGPFRLVKYALFLLREVFPEHDAICGSEGQAMLDHISGNGGAAERLAEMKGNTQGYLDGIFGRNR